MEKLLLSVAETAETLGIKRATLYKLIATGQLRPVKVGRLTRFTRDELVAFVEKLTAEQRENDR